MIKKIITTAEKLGGTPVIVVSHSHLTANGKNPLNVNTKLRYLRKMFPNVEFKDSGNKSIARIVKNFKNNSIMIHGENRFKPNGKSQFNFLRNSGVKKFISSGNRVPNEESIAGVSATAVREAAMRGNTKTMRNLMSNRLSNNNIKNIMKTIRPRTATKSASARRPSKRSRQ